MINSIKNLGDLVLKNIAYNNELPIDDPKTFLLGLVERRPAGDNIARLLFSLRTRSVRLSRPEELEKVTDKRLEKYLWVGNPKGQKPRNRLTTNRLYHLVSKTIPTILQDLGSWIDKSKELLEFESLVRKIREVFFVEKKGKKKRTYLLNPTLLGFEYRDVKDLAEKMREKAGYSKGIIALYTVSLETPGGKTIDLACHRGYEEYLSESFLRERQAVDGRCHICGVKRRVLDDPAFVGGTPLKIYVKDKKGFTSGIRDGSGARLKAFAVCPQCLRSLLAGDAYIRRRMTDRIKGLNVGIYLIPSLAGGVIGIEELEEWINYILDEFKSVASFDGLSGFQRRMNRYLRFKGMEHRYMLHILFGTATGSRFDLRYLIQDVPVSRFDGLREKAGGLSKQVAKLFGDDPREWYLSFSKISEIFPLRRGRRKGLHEWRPLIELYSAVLQGWRYPYRLLVEKGLQLSRIHRFGNYEACTIREAKPVERDEQLVRGILGVTLLIKYLKDIGVFMGGPEFKGGFSDLPDHVREWINLVGYDEEQQALFLLGVLIGKVGTAQYSKGDRKKSILDKVRFDGMDINRVMYLANRILEYLRIYRLLSENEVIYGCMMKLFNRNLDKWSKGDIENVFYMLSGYAFITLYTIKSGGGSPAKK